MCLKCVQWKHARQMVPLPSMFLTCSYLFPGAFAPSVKKNLLTPSMVPDWERPTPPAYSSRCAANPSSVEPTPAIPVSTPPLPSRRPPLPFPLPRPLQRERESPFSGSSTTSPKIGPLQTAQNNRIISMDDYDVRMDGDTVDEVKVVENVSAAKVRAKYCA